MVAAAGAGLYPSVAEAARAMNQMKDFVAKHHQGLKLEEAFRWRTSTLPNEFKADSISFYSAMEVALLSALTCGSFVYFSMLSINLSDWIWPIAIGAGVFRASAGERGVADGMDRFSRTALPDS